MSQSAPSDPILKLTGLSKRFNLEAGLFASAKHHVYALNGIDLEIRRGETYGLVGESGSGKTTLARLLVRLHQATAGTIEYFPEAGSDRKDLARPWNITGADARLLKAYRSEVKYIFQDPSSSLDPRMNVQDILTTGLRYDSRFKGRKDLADIAAKALETVGLRRTDLERRPGEFSGGQRQRISIARALVFQPRLLICDEVVSALDVSIQGQILNLLVDLKREFNLTLVFIAHDLTVVSYLADRIGVLYGGSLMEEGPASLFAQGPRHPYSRLLFDSIPAMGKPLAERGGTVGQPYNPGQAPVGCPFAGRCSQADEACKTTIPPVLASPHGRAACHKL